MGEVYFRCSLEEFREGMGRGKPSDTKPKRHNHLGAFRAAAREARGELWPSRLRPKSKRI